MPWLSRRRRNSICFVLFFLCIAILFWCTTGPTDVSQIQCNITDVFKRCDPMQHAPHPVICETCITQRIRQLKHIGVLVDDYNFNRVWVNDDNLVYYNLVYYILLYYIIWYLVVSYYSPPELHQWRKFIWGEDSYTKGVQHICWCMSINRQEVTCNRQHARCNKQQAIDNRHGQ